MSIVFFYRWRLRGYNFGNIPCNFYFTLQHNKRYPDRIIVYRDGVGDGQIDTVAKYEVKQLLATFKNIEPNYKPSLTVIIVQKRINTRLFAKCVSFLTKRRRYSFIFSN